MCVPHHRFPGRPGGSGRSRAHSPDRLDGLGGPAAAGDSRRRCAARRIWSLGMTSPMIFRIAFDALEGNKTRTGLTMLGVIIGVAAVITMIALGRGAQSAIEAQVR